MTSDETKPLGQPSQEGDAPASRRPQEETSSAVPVRDSDSGSQEPKAKLLHESDEFAEETIFELGDDEDGPAPRKFDDTEARALAVSCERFSDLSIDSRVQDAIAHLGWSAPTPVQKLCLPFTLKGRDVAGFAQTGTGKTGVFLITTSNKLLSDSRQTKDGDGRLPRAIILAPTRELAMQIEDDAKTLLKQSGLTSVAIFGGVDYDKQASKLREGVDVIVATPGRLMDYAKKGVVSFSDVQLFVCDEADRMFDMGFIEDVEFFLKRIPESAQKLLFSATTNEQVKELAFEYLESPEYISVNPEILTPEKIEQQAIHVHSKHKLKVLMGLLHDQKPDCAIIFTNTKLTADWLWFKLSRNGFEVDLITGDLPQKKRIRLIERIKRGELKALIATDVASRGLHISRVTHVYNFDLPDEPSNYIHRIGRTARAGARGTAISLVCDDYGQNLTAINALLGSAHTLRSTWFDESYLKIEDKAGNPFKERLTAQRENSKQKNVSEFNSNTRERGYRGGRPDRGPRTERFDQGVAPSRTQPPSRPPGKSERPHSESQALDHHGSHKQRHQRRRSHRDDKQARLDSRVPQRSPSPQQNRRERDDKRGRNQPETAVNQVLAAKPKGFFGMLKALFLSIFGGKSK